MSPSPDLTKKWLTVRETAEILGTSEEMVRRKIRAYELPASRLNYAPRSPWMINAAALQRRLEIDAHGKRVYDIGIVVGHSIDEFAEKLEQRHPDVRVGSPDGPTLAEHARATAARHELFTQIEREEGAEIRKRFEQLDEEQRFEEEAREYARRIRRAERLRDRALEILDEDDQDD